jgi:LPXTG-site transpeptidase (sortase) family protein
MPLRAKYLRLILILAVLSAIFLSTGTVQALTGNLSLTIAGTSEPGSSETPNGSSGNERPVLIGEVVTYSLSFEIDEGTSNGVNIVVAIPNGLQYISGSQSLSFNNDNGWSDTPTVTGGGSSGADVTFDFGTINNTDSDTNAETITVTFDAIVNNIASNQDGSILDVNSTLNANSALVDASETRSLKVIEPDLTLTKQQLDDYRGTAVTTGDAGDQIVYTVRITNNGNAPAYNIDLIDFIPVAYVTQFGATIGTGLPLPTNTYDGGTGEWHLLWPYLNPGGNVSMTIRTRVNLTVRPADTWTNTANITFTSLPDDDGSANNVPGAPGADNGLRNGDDGVGGAVDDYAATATTPAFLVDAPTIVKQAEYPSETPVATSVFPTGYSDSTSDPNTGISEHNASRVDLAIGETVSFIITVTYPEGTTSNTYLIDLASPYNSGISTSVLQLISAEVVHVGSNLSGTGVPALGPGGIFFDMNGDGDASRIQFSVGASDDILNTPDGVVDDNDRLVIRVTARADDENEILSDPANDLSGVSNDDGGLSRNRIQLAWQNTGGSTVTRNATADIDIVEPNLTISKSTISGSNLSAGDSAVFELTINNTGTAPAYNVVVYDLFPGVAIPYLAFGSVDAANSSCDDLAGFSIDSGVPPIVIFRFDQLNAGSSCTIRFSAIVQNSVADNTTYTNSARIDSYDSLDNNANADNRNYTGGSATSTFRTADTIPPTVTVPANITEEATSASGDAVSFSASANDNVDGTLTPTCVPASGSTFPLGTTTVTCSATDSAGNTGSNSFTITVQDITAPTVTVPANITQEATSASGNTITFTASATDIVDGSLTPTCTPPSGSTFPIATTTVTCSVTDSAGNTGSNSFTITVQDTTAPTVTVPANITQEATSTSGNTITFTASATDIVDGTLTPTCVPASGSVFPIGTTNVTCSVTDSASNTGSNSFTITVEDTTAPVVTVPANITEEATSPSGNVITFTASANDSIDGPLTPTCTPPSGSTFPIAITTVTCSATDNEGNTGSNSFTITVQDTTAPTVTINQGSTQADPTNSSPIEFDVVFSEDVNNFDNTDISITGMAGTPVIVVTSTGTGNTYTVSVSGMADGETITASIPLGAAQDASGNGNTASTSTDNSVTYDISAISITTLLAQPNNATLTNLRTYYTQFTSLEITYDTDAFDPPGDTGTDDATNPNNYLLIQSGPDTVYDTGSCLDYANNGGAVLDDDIQIPTGTVNYNSSTFTATLTLNNGTPLPFGEYRLFVCGTTSITDQAGNALNNGADTIITFTIAPIPERLPKTGFPMGQITTLPSQPASKAYTNVEMTLEIPSLNLSMPIVSVPQNGTSWDITWLGGNAGYLSGSAFPTWEGNTVITGHVWDAYNNPGPFAQLKKLRYGDQFYIHAFGSTYVYEVRENILLLPNKVDKAFQHEDYDWVTLLTCESYDSTNENYAYRRAVRAVLIQIR